MAGPTTNMGADAVLTNGRIMRVDECIDPNSLARLVAALEGDRRC